MKIMIVISSLATGGAERATAELSRQWASLGHDVMIVMLGGKEDQHQDIADDVELTALGLAAASSTPVAALRANLRRVIAIRREVRSRRPDVVIGMMDRTAVLVALACVGTRVRTIGCERTAPGVAPMPRSWRALRAITYGGLDLVIAQTAPAAAWILNRTLARRSKVIPNAIIWPLPALEPTVDPATAFPPGRHVALAVGRLSAEKRFDLLIEAFERVAASRPDWDLVIVGEGPDRRSLEALVERVGLTGRIRLPGRVGNLSAWYPRASIFVLTSDFEGFPNVLLEAMAHGLSPISVDCPFGPRDILRHGVDGLLTSPGQVGPIAESMALLMDDEGLRGRLGAAAVKVRERFSADRVAALWDEALVRGGAAG